MNNKSKKDELFITFIKEMDSLIKENEKKDTKQTKNLMNKLIALEKEFKKELLSTPQGESIYEDFMAYILDDIDGKGNMLSARVYFRERQDTFSKKMYSAFHEKNPKKLHIFKINYKFCIWSLNKYKGQKRKKLLNIVNEIENLRKVIFEKNMPLAVNRANLFWRNTSSNSLTYMDLIQNASEGLLIAIDKFVPAKNKITNNREFNGVSIGKMTLEMQENSSQTLVKLPPKEKRILYRTKKAKQKTTISREEVVDFVSQSFGGVTSSDIERIEAAANQGVSLDYKEDGKYSVSEKFADTSQSPLDIAEENEIGFKLLDTLKNLSVLERKIILLKFGALYGGIND